MKKRHVSRQLNKLNYDPNFQTFVRKFNVQQKNTVQQQTGGLDISNLTNLANQTSGLIQKGISTAQTLNTQAEKFSDQFNQLSTQVNKLTDTVSQNIPIDLNYTSPEFSQSASSPNQTQKFQSYGDSICLSKEFIADLRQLINELFAPRNDVPN